jgi:hypothetical protein
MQFTHLTHPPGSAGLNAEGHPSVGESLRESVARIALTGVLSPQFYRQHGGEGQAREFIPLITQIAAIDPLFMLKAAAVSRRANFKLFPKLACAAALAICPKVFEAVDVDRAVIELLATYTPMQLLEVVLLTKAKTFGKGLGSRAQRVYGAAMCAWSPYRFENFTLSDRGSMNRLLRILHPRLGSEAAKMAPYCLDKTPYDPGPTPRQKAMIFLEADLFVASHRASAILDNRLPFNALKGFIPGDDRDAWTAIRDCMSPLQLLLNAKSLAEKGVLTPAEFERRIDAVDPANTKLVPHDVLRPLGMTYTRWGETMGSSYAEPLTRLLARVADRSLPGLADKRVCILMDVSGSMAGGGGPSNLPNWVLAATLALPMTGIEGRRIFYFNDRTFPEGDNTAYAPLVRGEPVERLKTMLSVGPNGGTNIGMAIREVSRLNTSFDVLFVFTDEQENGVIGAHSAWLEFRQRNNPEAHLVIVNVSNVPWHTAKDDADGVTRIQTVTPLIYDQLQHYKQSPVQYIQRSSLQGGPSWPD